MENQINTLESLRKVIIAEYQFLLFIYLLLFK